MTTPLALVGVDGPGGALASNLCKSGSGALVASADPNADLLKAIATIRIDALSDLRRMASAFWQSLEK